MTDCINCIHADVSYGSRTIEMDGVTLNQNGGCNIVCTANGVSICFDADGEMVCSGFERKEGSA